MKKRIISILTALFAAAIFTFSLASCGSSKSNFESLPSIKPEHTHDYCIENTDAKYLESAATCQQKAIYYYYCECGEKGRDMFEYGEITEHTYSEVWSHDENYHWQNATCGCDLKQNHAKHVIDVTGSCSDCKFIPSTEGVVYTVSNDLTYAIVTGYNGISKTVRIADTYLGLPVMEISHWAFGYKSIISVIIPDSVTSIGGSAFRHCSNLKTVYYKGTAEAWNKISIENSNYYSTSAARYYYSITKPTESGNFWHYDENGNIVIW